MHALTPAVALSNAVLPVRRHFVFVRACKDFGCWVRRSSICWRKESGGEGWETIAVQTWRRVWTLGLVGCREEEEETDWTGSSTSPTLAPCPGLGACTKLLVPLPDLPPRCKAGVRSSSIRSDTRLRSKYSGPNLRGLA